MPPVVNTAEEAVAIRRLLEASGNASVLSPRILLVTSAFHMCRAQRLFERQALVVEPFSVDFKSRGAWADSRGVTQFNGFILLMLLMAAPALCASYWAV